MQKNNIGLSILPIIVSSILLLNSCNNGGATTNNYIAACNLPVFNAQIGNYLLTRWGQSVENYSTSTNNNSDIYVNAGFFTMTNYTPGAILLPTVSAIQRIGTNAIYDYFTHFLLLKPVMSLPNSESNVFEAISCGYGSSNGYYNFVVTDPITLVKSTVNARFTFLYKYESTPFVESFTVESGNSIGQVMQQTNAPGWYVWTQNSAVVPDNH